MILLFMFFLYGGIYIFRDVCNKYVYNEKVYKRLILVPCVEWIVELALLMYTFSRDAVDDFMVCTILILFLMPVAHIVLYFCAPYTKDKLSKGKGVKMMLFVFGYLGSMLAVLCYLRKFI